MKQVSGSANCNSVTREGGLGALSRGAGTTFKLGVNFFIELKWQNVMPVLLLYFYSDFTMRSSLTENSTQI